MEKSNEKRKKMRNLFNQVVENGESYQLLFGYTEDVGRFNYVFVHGSKTKIVNLIVGWNEASRPHFKCGRLVLYINHRLCRWSEKSFSDEKDKKTPFVVK